MSPALRASFVASVRDVQELEIEMLMRLHTQQPDRGFAEAALLASERGRARSLLDMLGESGVEIRNGVDAALLARERELARLISAKAEMQTRLLSNRHTGTEAAATEGELDALAVEYQQLQSRIRQVSPQYAALTQATPLDLKEIQTKVLDADTVLLEYALGPVKSVPLGGDAIVNAGLRVPSRRRHRSRSPASVRSADRAQPAARGRDAGSAAGARAAGRYGISCGRAKGQPYAPGPRCCVPGTQAAPHRRGRSAAVPALWRSAGMWTGLPLIVSHEIVTAPSASVVALLRRESSGRKPASKLLAVFADPVFHPDDPRIAGPQSFRVRQASFEIDDFARLRFSRNEAEDIRGSPIPQPRLKRLTSTQAARRP